MAKGSENSRALIAAATRGDLAEVQRLIPISNCTFKGSSAILLASKNHHNDIVKLLTPHSDTRRHDSLMFRRAAQQGNVDMLTFLLPHSDPQARNSEALVFAIQGNHKDAFDFLLPLSDLTQCPNDFITSAANHKHTDFLKIVLQYVQPTSSDVLKIPALYGYDQAIKLLLPYCDVAHDNHAAWRWALHNWHPNVVRLLSEYVDTTIFEHLALATACSNSDQAMIDLLFAQCNRSTVLSDLQCSHLALLPHEIQFVEERLAQEQHARIEQEIVHVGNGPVRKKM